MDVLKAIAEAGTRLPERVVIQPEYQLPDSYVDLGREIRNGSARRLRPTP